MCPNFLAAQVFFSFNIFIAQKTWAWFQMANMLILSPGLESSCWKKNSKITVNPDGPNFLLFVGRFWCATSKVWQIMQRNTCKRTALRSKLRCWSTVVLVELSLSCCQLHLGRKEMQIKKEKLGHFRAKRFFSKSSVQTLKNKEGII